MGSRMQYSEFVDFTKTAVALRRRQRLQPVGGQGDKIFPPTYPGEGRNAGPRHVFEVRRIDGKDVVCVLVDSVQSQANRLEEALLAAMRDDQQLAIPHVVVDFRGHGLAGLSEITSLEAPHRVYDAILRDSALGDKPFMESEEGLRLTKASPHDASALLEMSPTALLLGAWHSTGGGGGLGAKFPRALVSEIIAVNTPVDEFVPEKGNGAIELKTAGRRTGSRIDPLGVLRRVEVWKAEDGSWDAAKFAKAKQVRPSEINHGNIAPSVDALGITCDYAEHTAVLTFAGLRRLGFGGGDKDVAARAYIAALGLVALAEQDARGYALRSRCDLVCERRAPLEVVRPDGSTTAVEITPESARRLYTDAYAATIKAGLALAKDPLRLTPQPKLVAIVRQSQEQALKGQGGEAGESE